MFEDAGIGSSKFHKGKNIRIKKVLPKCVKMDLIFMFQGRVSKSLTYSQDLQGN